MRQRLDQALVAQGLAASRAKARDFVVRGAVTIAGRVVDKPAMLVGEAEIAALAVAAEVARFVSRGAEKLIAALDGFGFDPTGRVCMDVGASTGGFTDVLLARGAQRVYAVDVGHGQLHARLAGDPRVVALERTDARVLDRARVGDAIEAVVVDVSFISLAKVLAAPMALTAPGAWLVALVKPQFEVGPAGVGKGGIVRDAALRAAAVDEVAAWIGAQPGWAVVGRIVSPIKGGDGNQETLVGAVRT